MKPEGISSRPGQLKNGKKAMQKGISTYTYTWAVGVPGSMPETPMTADSLISKAADLGVDCVQLADNLPLAGMDTGALAEIRNHARQLRINIEVGGRGLTEENLHQHIDLAFFFGSPVLRMVIDGKNYEPDLDTIVAVIRNALGTLESSQVTLALENHDRLHAATFREIVEWTGSRFTGICLDCVNSMGIGEGIDTVAEILAPYTVNLHIKDFTVKRVSPKMGFVLEGAPAGKGLLDLQTILEKIRPYNRCHSAILELWTPPAVTLADTLEREDSWARESIAYINKILAKP
ncbi:MAG: sugar phosphate isomerase/epimerase [Bacteroidetes bacterium]|nr:MAG: sugar phosphate isomerase/epimerase [Bacteroidota bacterium]